MRINILILINKSKVLKKECALIFKHSYIKGSYNSI